MIAVGIRLAIGPSSSPGSSYKMRSGGWRLSPPTPFYFAAHITPAGVLEQHTLLFPWFGTCCPAWFRVRCCEGPVRLSRGPPLVPFRARGLADPRRSWWFSAHEIEILEACRLQWQSR